MDGIKIAIVSIIFLVGVALAFMKANEVDKAMEICQTRQSFEVCYYLIRR